MLILIMGDTSSSPLSSTKLRRDSANLRERRRMLLINSAFERLKSRLPLSGASGACADDYVFSCCLFNRKSRYGEDEEEEEVATKKYSNRKLTKVDILRLTVEYIQYLSSLLVGDNNENNCDKDSTKTLIKFNKMSNNNQHKQEGNESSTCGTNSGVKGNMRAAKADTMTTPRRKTVRPPTSMGGRPISKKQRRQKNNSSKSNSKSLIDKAPASGTVVVGNRLASKATTTTATMQQQQQHKRLLSSKVSQQQYSISWAKNNTDPFFVGDHDDCLDTTNSVSNGLHGTNNNDALDASELARTNNKQLKHTKLWTPALAFEEG